MMPLLPVDPCGNGANCYTHCGHVYRCCGFIHDKNAALANKGSGQAKELSLPYTEVLSSFCYHCIYNENQLVKSEHNVFERAPWKLCLCTTPAWNKIPEKANVFKQMTQIVKSSRIQDNYLSNVIHTLWKEIGELSSWTRSQMKRKMLCVQELKLCWPSKILLKEPKKKLFFKTLFWQITRL